MESMGLVVWLLEWQLACETDSNFTNLVDDKIDFFLQARGWDSETIQPLQVEVNDILREKA